MPIAVFAVKYGIKPFAAVLAQNLRGLRRPAKMVYKGATLMLLQILTFTISLSAPAELIELATQSNSQSSSALAAERIVALSAMGSLLDSAAGKKHLNAKSLEELVNSAVKKNTLVQVQSFLQQIAHSDEVIQEMALREFLKPLSNKNIPEENAEALALKSLYQGEVRRTIAEIYKSANQIKRQVIASKSARDVDQTKVRSLIEQIENSERALSISSKK